MITARRVVVVSLLLILCVAYKMADGSPAPACTPPPRAATVPFKEVPSILLDALKDHLGEIAAPGGRFNAGDADVVLFGSPSHSRFILFWRAGERWVVATEHSSRSYYNRIFLYDLGDDERKAALIAEKAESPATACA